MTYDIKDVILEAQAEVAEVILSVMQDLVEPMMIDALRLRWDTLPDEVKEQLKKLQPETYAGILQKLELQ